MLESLYFLFALALRGVPGSSFGTWLHKTRDHAAFGEGAQQSVAAYL